MTDFDIQEIVKAERNKYQREWRANNKDKVKEINRRYWIKRAKKAQMKEVNNGGK